MQWGNTIEREDPAEMASKRARDIEFERTKIRALDASDAEAKAKHVYDPWQMNRILTVNAHERNARKEKLARLIDQQRAAGDRNSQEWRPAAAGFWGADS
jgi:hypothetical protein